MKKVIYIIVMLYPFLSFGQNNEEDLYNWFDKEVGFENVNIHQGKEYRKKQRSINGKHPFFKSDDFVKGTIFYQGAKYSNLFFKYDLFAQELIVRLKEHNFTGITIQLFKNNVKRFSLHHTQFVWIDDKDVKEKPIYGFYQEVYSTPSIQLLVKKSKYKKEVPSQGVMLAEYKKSKNTYFVFYKNHYTKIKSKKSIINIFPSLKNQINAFYRKHSSLRKKTYTLFLAELFRDVVNNNL